MKASAILLALAICGCEVRFSSSPSPTPSPSQAPLWEQIAGDPRQPDVWRAEVPGGWLYRVSGCREHSIAFVPSESRR